MLNPYGTDVEFIIGKLLTYPYPTGERLIGCISFWPRVYRLGLEDKVKLAQL